MIKHQISVTLFNLRWFNILTVNSICSFWQLNSIWGVVPTPLTEKKIVKKNGKCNQDYFSPVLLKSYWTIFKTIFETLSDLGACHVTIIQGVIYKKSMIFKVFGVYLSELLIFLHEIFFVSKILPSSCDKHQNFDYGCSR